MFDNGQRDSSRSGMLCQDLAQAQQCAMSDLPGHVQTVDNQPICKVLEWPRAGASILPLIGRIHVVGHLQQLGCFKAIPGMHMHGKIRKRGPTLGAGTSFCRLAAGFAFLMRRFI